MSIASITKSPLISLTNTGKECIESSAECFTSSFESTAKSTNWVIQNRGGIAKITGKLIVPPQYICPGYNESE